MTVYYSITFLLLAAEMVTFCFLVLPLPYSIRKKLFNFLSESPLIAKLVYALKITFVSVGVLFVDAVQRMFRVTAESEMAKQNAGAHVGNPQSEANFAARKFYAQRNVYLTGFCLFLSLVLTRTFYIVLDLIHTQEHYAKLQQETGNGSKANGASSGQEKTIADLKAKLDAKTRDFDTLKNQAASQAAEYDRLASRYNEATGQKASDKRKD